ncbi:MAG: toll/interleukin-1 receptor domain-containing protein [Clostridia bacterium]|nr:toll/interleukin-1 receptor domain-containing protein [Clostridia bacterium]
MDEFLYDAFISYSHRDMKWGRWLQRRLEHFALPADIRAARGSEEKHLRVFRDQTDLAGIELQESLRKSMEQSRYQIVICSPDSARSKWVGEEIRYFKSLGRAAYIIPFVVAGEPESDHPERECYHEELRNVEDKHLLGANIQELGKNKAFLRLTAILLDIRFDRLINRAKQHRRRVALTAGTVAIVILAVVGILLWENHKVNVENDALSYDIYGAAILSIGSKNVFEPEDVAFLEVSAKAGNADAMLYLAYCYKEGMGTEKDEATAFKWFLQAANAPFDEQDEAKRKLNATAMAAVGNCYGNAIGTEEDLEQSFAWYLRAAEAGNADAMLIVGLYYESGTGVDQNLETAFQYFLMAANAGNEMGMYNTATCYLLGNGVKENAEQAFVWAQKLAERNNPGGMYNLAVMYQFGRGTEENPELAYTWYRRAADAGSPDAMFMAGWCIENHYGISNVALEWYLRAAEQGNEMAMEAAQRILGKTATDAPEGLPTGTEAGLAADAREPVAGNQMENEQE